MTDLVADLLRANLAAGLAVLVVMALRLSARRHFGAHVAYSLWLAVPLVFLASLVPAQEAETEAQAAEAAGRVAALVPGGGDLLSALIHSPAVTWAWAAGAILALALACAGQVRFLRRAKAGLAGPALVGVLCPRIVVPTGYEDMFTEEERALVRAHERAHMDREDPRTNALITLGQCLCWFNPLIHLAAHLARLDQEVACDATVMQRRPGSRRRYAETMLKTQIASTALPLGCHWVSGRHPLETRIAMLKAPPSSDSRLRVGAGVAAGFSILAAFGAWASQPPAPPHDYFVPIPLRPEFLRQGSGQPVVMINLTREEVAALTQPAKP